MGNIYNVVGAAGSGKARKKRGGAMPRRARVFSEVDFGIVIAALEELFHLLLARLTGIGARAGVGDGVLRDLGQALQEHLLRDEALGRGIAVRAVAA
jgi:hypothetical protein